MALKSSTRCGRGVAARNAWSFWSMDWAHASAPERASTLNTIAMHLPIVMVSGRMQCFLKLGPAHPTHPTLVILVARDTL